MWGTWWDYLRREKQKRESADEELIHPTPVLAPVYSEAGTKLYESLKSGVGWELEGSILKHSSGMMLAKSSLEYIRVWCSDKAAFTDRDVFTEDDHCRLLPAFDALQTARERELNPNLDDVLKAVEKL